jgi:hypothetical protein
LKPSRIAVDSAMARAFDSATDGVVPTPVGDATGQACRPLLGLHQVAISARADLELLEHHHLRPSVLGRHSEQIGQLVTVVERLVNGEKVLVTGCFGPRRIKGCRRESRLLRCRRVWVCGLVGWP